MRRASRRTWSPTRTPRPSRRRSASSAPLALTTRSSGRRALTTPARDAPLLRRRDRRHARLRRRDAGLLVHRGVLTDVDGLLCARPDPAGELYAAARGQGATLNGEPLRFDATPESARARERGDLPAPGLWSCPACARPPTPCSTGPGSSVTPARAPSSWRGSPRAASTPGFQPQTDPWDWLPGRLLVEEAGGTTTVVEANRSAGTTSSRSPCVGLRQGHRRASTPPVASVLRLRRPDHHRRAQAPLPRQGLVGPRPARPAGAGGQARTGGRGARA